MSFASQLKQTVDVYRLNVTSGSKKEWSKVGTIKTMIAPMSATTSQIANMAFVRAFQGFVLASADVLIGDYLQDSTGDKYDVQGARRYPMGSQPFIELTLQKQTQQGQI